MLDINLKQYLREYFMLKMNQARGQSKHFYTSAGIIIRDTREDAELEDFLDDMWVFISKKNMQNEQ